MARPRKPDHHKKLAGTERKHRQHPQTAAEALERTPRAPSHLTEKAAAEWRKLAPIVVALGTISTADLRAFELLCCTLATASEAEETIASEGMALDTGAGGRKSHPAVKVMETARSQAAALLRDFGLTPKSRAYVSPPPKRSTNKFQGLMPINDFSDF